MRLLEITLADDDYAFVSAPPRAYLPVLQKLLEKAHLAYKFQTSRGMLERSVLGKVSNTLLQKPLDGYETLSEACLRPMGRILEMMPRHDTIDPILLEQIPEVELTRLFIKQLNTDNTERPCKLIEFIQYEPCKPTKEVPKLEDEITMDNIPIPSSGNADADLLGTLLTVMDAMSAQLIYESWDAETIDKVLFAMNERQRNPEDRKADYMQKEFAKIKEANPSVYDKLRKGQLNLREIPGSRVQTKPQSD